MTFSVYELYDTYGNIVWVGETRRPKGRLWQHRSKQGHFTGQDISMYIVARYEDRKEAWAHQIQLQQEYNLITDNEKKSNGGVKMTPKRYAYLKEHNKRRARLGGLANKGKKFVMKNMVCPQCGLEGKGANMTRYHFNNCKNKK